MSLGTGGIENMVVDIANTQSRYHCVVLVVVNNVIDENVRDRLLSSVQLIKLNRQPKSLSPFFLFDFYRVILKRFPDQLHVHHKDILKLLPFSFLRKKIKIVHTVHDTGITYKRELGYANTVCAISCSVKTDLKRRQGINAKVIYNGIDHCLIPVKQCYKRQGLLKIVQIGRLLHEKKGQDILIDALHTLHKKKGKLNFTLDIIGAGNSEKYLMDQVTAYNLEGYVHFNSLLSRNSVYERLHQWDILIQPSRYEGFGLTVAEAMSAGVPVIVSDKEGPMEIIRHGKYGEFFASGNAEHLAQCIESLQKSYYCGDIQHKAVIARKYVSTHFAIEKTAEQYALL